MILSFGFQVSGFGRGVLKLGCRVWCSRLQFAGSGHQVSGCGSRISEFLVSDSVGAHPSGLSGVYGVFGIIGVLRVDMGYPEVVE